LVQIQIKPTSHFEFVSGDTAESEFLDLVDFGGDAFSLESVIQGVAKTHMTDSTENASPPQSTRSRNSDFLVQIQIRPTSRFEFVPQDTEESEFLDLRI